MRNIFIYIFATISILFPHRSAAMTSEADPDFTFSNISANDGLSQNTILSIAQDRFENIWFATFDGLNKYDGYEFTVFRHDEADSTSIGGNTIRVLFVGNGDKVWIGTTNGLSIYDMQKEEFRNYSTPEGFVTGIAEISGTRMMVGTENRLRVFDMEKDAFIDDVIPEYMANTSVNSLKRHGDTIYIGTKHNGLFSYTIKNNEFRRISSFTSTWKINVILPQEDGDALWIGTEGDGLYRLGIKDLRLTNWRHTRGKQGNELCSNYVRSLAFDNKGRLWIGTFNGLNILDDGHFMTMTSDPFTQGSLSQNSVRSIFRDIQDGMWLGTYFGGVNYWNSLKNNFVNIQRSQNGKSLNDNIISCIVEDGDRTLWIGTNSGGVNHYNPETGKFSYYPLQENARPADIESNDIKAIYIENGSPLIYIGAHAGGLNILDSRNGRIENFETLTSVCPPQDVYSILRKDGRYLWVGTLNGLYTFDKVTKRFEKEETGTAGNQRTPVFIKVLFMDSERNLWIGGEDGLRVCLTNPQNGNITGDNTEIPAELSKLTFIQDIAENSTRVIWIATRNGLYSLDRHSGAIRHYTEADGLPSNIIHGIEEDSHGRLWLSTDFGISCFNPYSDTFHNFTVKDGLQGNQFNTYAHCKTSDGNMYFGGLNGITAFIPEKLEDNPFTPQPVITELKVLNSPVHPDDGSGILKESISVTRKVTLKHRFNSFSIKFSVPNYLAGQNNTFSYILEGFDKDWHTTSISRTATYSNLPHGKYRFIVKAANNDGKWNQTPTVLEIKVKPRWYQSILANIIFVLLTIAVIVAIIIFMLERKNMENRLILEKQERVHQEEIDQMKMRFFINISHELRSPLTMIINPLQEILSQINDPWIRKQLKYVERNAQRLLHLVNQLMDYRRAELGVFKLRIRPENAYRIVWENWSYYENLAKSKKIRYTLLSDLAENKLIHVDGQYLELIVNNLLSNAFKYTDEGSITVKLTENENNFVLSVSDTGIGIPAVAQNRIFERFYQIESKHIGSGIGLSLVHRLVELHHGQIILESEEGKGSTFTVKFPQDLGTYSKEELENGSAEAYATNSKEMYILDTEIPEEESNSSDDFTKRGRILIAEDNAEARNYMNNGLSRLFDITLASNGTEALELLKTKEVDIVITDTDLPVTDGLKLCASIKQNSDTCHIPVIVLSAKTENKDHLDALKSGADDYMLKPFSMAVLVTKLQNMMRTRTRLHDKATKTMEIVPEKVAFNPIDEDFLKRAVAIIEKNMDNVEFTTDELAKAMNMSRSNLHLRLKAISGESALEFIHKVRFREACKLLKQGTLTVAEISDKVGFSTPSYFATCFKKHMGMNPSEYIQELKSKHK